MDYNATEVHKLKERLSKQQEQQGLLEQIVSNISSLVEGSGDPMCIFDKDGFFMHVNAACRKMLGISDQHSSQLNVFDFYTSWDRDRVFKESVQRRATKWSGNVTFIKGGVNEIRVSQVIELLHSSKNDLDGTFFKSYITIQDNAPHEKLQSYYEMIRHMPVGVALWKLEKSSARLLCSNSLASQYVGVALDLRKDIHETLPNGAEVHHFLEEVVKTQRVCVLEKFRSTPTGREVTVTAFPLTQDCVAVVLEPPKKDGLMSAVESGGVGLAMVENQRLSQFNDHFVVLAGNQKELSGKDVITVLEQHVRPESRPQLFELRRAILEARVHNVDIETEQHQWKVCVHPFADRRCMIIAYRINTKAPPAVHRSTFPILPHLREALPIAPSQPATPTQSQTTSTTTQTSMTTTAATSTAAPQVQSTSTGLDTMFRDLVENFPCGVAIVKAERIQDMMCFRLVDVNKAARVFSDHLIVGKTFDEAAPAPFDASFVRILAISAQTHERRVVSRLNLYGSYLVLAARTIPLRDHYVGIAFEEATMMVPQSYNQGPGNGKRSHTDLENVHLVLPNRRLPTKPEEVQAPAATTPNSNPSTQNSSIQPTPKHEQGQPERPFSPRAHHLPDVGSLLNNPLPKPMLPPLHSAHASLAGILSPTSREKNENPLVQQCVIGIVYCDVNGKLLVVNRAFCNMLGYSEYELIDLPIVSICNEDADVVQSVMRQLTCGDSNSFDVPLRFHSKRLHPIWTLTTFSMSRSAGERASVLLQVQQTTRIERFPEVLFADREVLRLAFKELALSSVVMEIGAGAPLRISSANNAFCDVIGSNEEEIRGRPMTDVIYPDDREKTAKVVHEILTGRIPCHQLSVRIHSRVGPIWAFLSLSVVHNSKSQPVVLVAQLQPMDKVS